MLRLLFHVMLRMGMFASAGTALLAQPSAHIPPPMGGFVQDVAIQDARMAIAVFREYLQEETAALFISRDTGKNWDAVPTPAGATGLYAHLAFGSAGELYFMTERALYRTTNDGAQWSRLDSVPSPTVHLLRLQTNAAGHVYLLDDAAGLRVSTNRGTSWKSASFPASLTKLLRDTKLSVDAGDNIYAWNTYPGWDELHRSTDAGQTWHLFMKRDWPVGIAATSRQTAYAALRAPTISGMPTPHAVMKTTSGGQRWDTVKVFGDGAFVQLPLRNQLRSTPQGDLYFIYVDTLFQPVLAHSSDDGITWRERRFPPFPAVGNLDTDGEGHILVSGSCSGLFLLDSLGASPTQQGFVPLPIDAPFAVTDRWNVFANIPWVWRQNCMITWDHATGTWDFLRGLGHQTTGDNVHLAIPFLLAGEDTLFQPRMHFVNRGGQFTYELMRSTDAGKSWSPVQPPLRTASVHHGQATDRSGPWFAATDDSLFLSTDHGTTWSGTASPLRSSVAMAAGNGTTYACSILSGLWKSSAFPGGWDQVSSWFFDALDVTEDGVLYGVRTGAYSLYQSTDGGKTWRDPLASQSYARAHGRLVFSRDTVIVLDNRRGLYVSLDAAKTWRLYPDPGISLRNISTHQGYVFLGTEHDGIYSIPLRILLAAPELLSPGNADSCQATDLVLRWSLPDSTKPCRLRVATDTRFLVSSLRIDTVLAATTWQATMLQPNTTYYWQVEQSGLIGEMKPSALGSFTTTRTVTPEILSHRSGEHCIEADRPLRWTEHACALASYFEIAADAGFVSLIIADSVTGPQSAVSLVLPAGADLYARVRILTAEGRGPWSKAVSFGTMPDTLPAPLQVEPDDSAWITEHDKYLRWEKPLCARSVELLVSRSRDFDRDTVLHMRNGYGSAAVIHRSWPVGVYFWKVRAENDTLPAIWSDTREFTIDRQVSVRPIAETRDIAITAVYPQPLGGPASRSRSLTLEYRMTTRADVEIVVHDLLGRAVSAPVRLSSQPGANHCILSLHDLPPAMYVLKLRSGDAVIMRPIIVSDIVSRTGR